MRWSAKRRISWRNLFHECSKRCTGLPSSRVTMSDMVSGQFVDLTEADDGASGGPAYREKIEETDVELTKVIEDFGRAVDVEALRLAQKSGKPSLPYSDVFFFNGVV